MNTDTTTKIEGLGAETGDIAKIGYTASIILPPIHNPNPNTNPISIPIKIEMMNEIETNSTNNPDLKPNPIKNEVNDKIAGQVEIEVKSPRFYLTRFQHTAQTLPPFTPPSDFGLYDSTSSTPSTQDQDNKIDSTGSSELSKGIGELTGNEGSAMGSIPTTNLMNSSGSVRLSAGSLRIKPIHKNRLSDPVHDFSKLNRSDLRELHQHHELLTPNQRNLLKTVQKKQEIYPQRYKDDYLRHSSLLLLSNGWSSADTYSMCSVPNKDNRSGQCRLHKYCPYCCYLVRQRALARFVPVYELGQWFFLTGSFQGQLSMNTAQDYHELTCYWDAYKMALKELVDTKMIRGVYWTEELAVNTIAPVQVLPHIHAIVEADELSGETLLELSELVAQNLRAALGPDGLIPNIHTKNLNSQRKLLSHIQYQFKPIKIVRAYDLAWEHCLHNDRSGAVKLNSETTDLVLGYSTATKDRTKINFAGNLNPKTKSYIGTKTADLKKVRDEVDAVIKEGVDYIEIEEELI